VLRAVEFQSGAVLSKRALGIIETQKQLKQNSLPPSRSAHHQFRVRIPLPHLVYRYHGVFPCLMVLLETNATPTSSEK
jgi:hypothetical protein